MTELYLIGRGLLIFGGAVANKWSFDGLPSVATLLSPFSMQHKIDLQPIERLAGKSFP